MRSLVVLLIVLTVSSVLCASTEMTLPKSEETVILREFYEFSSGTAAQTSHDPSFLLYLVQFLFFIPFIPLIVCAPVTFVVFVLCMPCCCSVCGLYGWLYMLVANWVSK